MGCKWNGFVIQLGLRWRQQLHGTKVRIIYIGANNQDHGAVQGQMRMRLEAYDWTLRIYATDHAFGIVKRGYGDIVLCKDYFETNNDLDYGNV